MTAKDRDPSVGMTCDPRPLTAAKKSARISRGVPSSSDMSVEACRRRADTSTQAHPRTGSPCRSETRTDRTPNEVSCRSTPPRAGTTKRPPAVALGSEHEGAAIRRPVRLRVLRGRSRHLHGVAATDWLHPDVEVACLVGGVRDEPPVGRPRHVRLQARIRMSDVSASAGRARRSEPCGAVMRRVANRPPRSRRDRASARTHATSAAATLCLARPVTTYSALDSPAVATWAACSDAGCCSAWLLLDCPGHLVAQRLQVEQQVLHDLIALLPVLAQGLADDALELGRRVGHRTAPAARAHARESPRAPRCCSAPRTDGGPRPTRTAARPATRRPSVRRPSARGPARATCSPRSRPRCPRRVRTTACVVCASARSATQRRELRQPEVQHLDDAIGPHASRFRASRRGARRRRRGPRSARRRSARRDRAPRGA